MSSYDENGNGVHWVISHGLNGTPCELCGKPISKVKDSRLFNFDDEYFCLPCLQEIFAKYETAGYCDHCMAGMPEADKPKYFEKCKVYPWGGETLCIDCIINEHLISVEENDPIEE